MGVTWAGKYHVRERDDRNASAELRPRSMLAVRSIWLNGFRQLNRVAGFSDSPTMSASRCDPGWSWLPSAAGSVSNRPEPYKDVLRSAGKKQQAPPSAGFFLN
jgi:hypothetical protein